MKGLLILVVLISSIESQGQVFSFPNVAIATKITITTLLEKAGVENLDPYDPSLPYPQVPAIEAFVNRATGALAYYNYEGPTGILCFKNRLGGNTHTISAGMDHIQFANYFSGVVAHGIRSQSVHGYIYNLYCRSVPVNREGWDACIKQQFLLPLFNEMTM